MLVPDVPPELVEDVLEVEEVLEVVPDPDEVEVDEVPDVIPEPEDDVPVAVVTDVADVVPDPDEVEVDDVLDVVPEPEDDVLDVLELVVDSDDVFWGNSVIFI